MRNHGYVALGVIMQTNESPDMLDTLLNPSRPIPLDQKLVVLETISNGLIGHPEFIHMMEAAKDNPSNKITTLDGQVAAIEDSITGMKAYLNGELGRRRLGEKVDINAQLQATVNDLGLAYKRANEAYQELFPEKAAKEGYVPPFDMVDAVMLGADALKGATALGYGEYQPSELPTDKEIAESKSPTIYARRTPTYRILTGDSEYTRAIENFLAFNMIMDSPEYQRMMKQDAQEFVDKGLISMDNVKYHNANVRAFEAAGEAILPYILDESDERVTQDQTGVLGPKALSAARLVAKKLPEFVNFLNDLHGKLYPDSEVQNPFDIDQSKAAARTMSAQRLYAEVHDMPNSATSYLH
jgi:hypothetical protein